MNRPRPLAAAALTVALAVGCSGQSTEQYVAAASAHLGKGETQAAIIELKNALQKDPDSAPARLLHGKALLAASDPVAAEVELRKARDLGATEDQVLPELARTMLLLGQPEKITSQFALITLPEAEAQADLKTTIAAAYAQQREPRRAEEAMVAALSAQASYVPALLVQARMKSGAGDIDGALELLDRILARDPRNAQAGVAKGYVLWLGRQDAAAALQTHRKVLEAHPDNVPARAEIVTILFRQGQRDEARQQFDLLKKQAPNHPETIFFEAQFAYVDRQYKRSRELTDALLKAVPEHVRALELAAAAEYHLGNDVQVQAFLGRALKVQPGLVLSRQILAQSYLRTNQPAKAAQVLAPLVSADHADGESLALAGYAYLQLGETKRADEAFKRASQRAPGSAKVRTQVAVAMISGGQTGVALRELEAIAKGDPGAMADLALINTLVAQKDFQGALKAIDALQAKLPGKPLPDQLRGQVLVSMRDADGARRSFEAALAKDPTYFPAVAALASIEVATGKADAARQRVIGFLKVAPNNAQAMLMLAEIPTAAGTPPLDAVKWLADVVNAAPDNPRTHLTLIQRHLTLNQGDAALTAAQVAAVALPNNLDIIAALGQAQLLVGQTRQAASTFTRLAALQPASAQVQMYLAETLLAEQDFVAAGRALTRATELDPDLTTAWRSLAMLALRDGKPLEALSIARGMQKRKPKDALGYAVEGDIEINRKNWAAAATAYRTALQYSNASEAAIKLHTSLRAADKPGDAAQVASDWEKRRPNDPAFHFYLGDLATQQRDYAGAEAQYRIVLANQPGNAMAMNNIAWLLLKQSKPGALAMAERANAAMPNRAPVLDTLASAQAAEGQLPEAIRSQQQAVAAASQDPSLRLTLARYLIKAGANDQAREQLRTLERLGDKFHGQAEVGVLLKSL